MIPLQDKIKIFGNEYTLTHVTQTSKGERTYHFVCDFTNLEIKEEELLEIINNKEN